MLTEGYFMFIDNLDKIIAMVGMLMGIELIAIANFTVSIAYFRSPVIAGVIGNMSSLGMILGVVFVFVKKEMRNIERVIIRLLSFFVVSSSIC